MTTHLNWDISHDKNCPKCKGKTLLIVAFAEMKIAEGEEGTFQNEHYEDSGGTLEIDDEISGHFCPKCRKLVSLSLNTYGA